MSVGLAAGGTITVDDDGPADFATLQEAIAAASPGDVVLVRDGIYRGTANRNLAFGGKAITVRSEDGPDGCVIDCENAGRAFSFVNAETAASRLEGLTIRNGLADNGAAILCSGASPVVAGCVFEANRATVHGGAVTLTSSTATISECRFIGNTASGWGGGLFCNASSPAITDCTFEANQTSNHGGAAALYNNSSPVIRRCRIQSNHANLYGGGVYCEVGSATIEKCLIEENTSQHGGGIFCNASSTNIIDCIIKANAVTENGGGIHSWNTSNPTIQRCTITGNQTTKHGGGIVFDGGGGTVQDTLLTDNQAANGGGAAFLNNCLASMSRCTVRGNTASLGGGLYATAAGAKPTISNTLVSANHATGDGGGVCSSLAYPSLVNCTIVDNTSNALGGGFCSYQYAAALTNCILWGNTPVANNGPATVTHSNAEGGLAGAGNINAEPLFADAGSGDYHLLAGSAGLDAGNGGAAGIGSVDRDGRTRVIGAGIDMGAYELGPNILHVPGEYAVIQDAIDAATTGDIVLVADGVYHDRMHLNKAITVRSVNGPRNCVISWNGQWNPIVGFFANATLQGFTICGWQGRDAYFGGGIYCDNCAPIIADCIIRDNVNAAGPAGISCKNASPTIVNCTIAGNVGFNGAGILCWQSPASIVNCTIADNVEQGTGAIGAGITSVNSAAAIRNSILWGNSTKQIHVVGSPAPTVTYSNIQGGWTGTGNINLDPQFASAVEYDYRLSAESPCLNRGSNAATGWTTDQDGAPRIRYGQIDLGAFEWTRIRRVPGDHADIQQAIDAAVSGDTVVVAEGIWMGPLDFLGKAITVRSECGPRGCVIDANSGVSAVSFQAGESAAAVLEGFTITGGIGGQSGGGIKCTNWAAPTIRNCIITNNQADKGAAVAAAEFAFPTLTNCLIHHNTGGAIFSSDWASVGVIHCTVVDNEAAGEDLGGGFRAEGNSRIHIANAIVRANTPDQVHADPEAEVSITDSNIEGGWSGGGNINADTLFAGPEIGDYHLLAESPDVGAARADGHGLPWVDMEGRSRYSDGAVDMGCYEYGHETRQVPADFATIQEAIDAACYGDTILVAPGTYAGGLDFRAKAITLQAQPGTEECVIDCAGAGFGVIFKRGERADSVLAGFTIINAAGENGGAVVCLNSSPTIVNCLFRNNTAERGAAVFSLDAAPTITNCTIVANTAALAGGGVFASGSPAPTVTNCILWSNGPEQIAWDGDAPVVTFSDIQGGYAGEGNISADPMFVNAAGGDYRLTNSAAFGTPSWYSWDWYLRPVSPCVDTGSNAAAGLPSDDKAGNPRSCRANPDMGAYEVKSLAVTVAAPAPQNDEYRALAWAVDHAHSGDTITVADGIYQGGINFGGKAITLCSLNGPANCIIDNINYGGRVITIANGEGADTVVSGFTIRNGGCKGWDRYAGAGIYCDGSSPTITDCVITGNSSSVSQQYTGGGGIYCTNGAAPLIQRCTITGNSTNFLGGGIGISQYASPSIIDCIITNNSASDTGGGIGLARYASATVINCLIQGNSGSRGGGIGLQWADAPTNTGCSITCINCTITANNSWEGGGLHAWAGSWYIFNTIIWGNGGGEYWHYSGGPWEFYNCHIGGADPLFRGPGTADFRLLEGSPCYNTGGYGIWYRPVSLPETDLAGNPRVLYGNVDIGAYELEYRPVVAGQLQVSITPAQAAQEGAQWCLADNVWHNSGDVVSGLIAGFHTVYFKALPGWFEPVPLSVWVSGDTQAAASAEYKSTHFSIGEIPALEVRQGSDLEFQVRAGGLTGTVTYGCRLNHVVPAGTMTIDPATGRFTYTPAAGDREPIAVTFTATGGGQSVSQTVEITPVGNLPAEYAMFDAPTQPLPDPEADEYVLKEVLTNPAGPFNNTTRPTRTINILGKEVVFEAGHENDLYVLDNNDDIKEMNIFAEKLIVRSPLRLPQTCLTIYARHIRFEGASSCIDTTPRSLTQPAQGIGQDGAAGLKGGTITLYTEAMFADGSQGNRFVARGGNGQAPGPGQHGANGQSFAPLTSCPQPILWPNTVFMTWQGGECRSPGWRDAPDYPMDGKDAVAAGRPGEPGEGGNVHANIDVRAFVNIPGGAAQPSSAAELHAAYDRFGGQPGAPYPAFGAYHNAVWGGWIMQVVNRPGSDQPAPEPNRWVGPDGQFHRVGHALSWVHPGALRMIVAWAKDAYLNGYAGEAMAVFKEYLTPVNQYMASAAWANVPEKSRLEIEQLRDEILTYVHQIQCGLDFFGNPPGWAPMLSFEITRQAYEREVDRAIQVLYLSHWLGGVMGDAAKETAALETARKTLKEQIDDFKTRYTAAVNLIPAMKTESQEIAARAATLMQMLQEKEQQLLAQAAQNVKDRNEVPWWKKALRIAGSLLTTMPRAHSPEGAIAAGFGALTMSVTEEFFSDNAWPAIANKADVAKQFNSIDFGAAADNWMTDETEIIAGKSEAELAGYLANLRESSAEIADNMTQIKDTLKETSLSNEEVEAELIKLKQADPEFNALVDDLVEFMVRKEVFGQRLAQVMQSVSSLSNGVRQNLLAVDALNRRAGEVAVVVDQRAELYLKEMERRAKARLLKYYYYLSKAYEYRLLVPFAGRLNLAPLFDRFVTIASANGRLAPADFAALRPILTEQLDAVAEEILDRFIASRGGGELSTSFTFDLSAEEVERLNRDKKITINLFERGLFLTSEEDIRIVNLGVESLTPLNPQTGCGVSYIKVYMEHSGVSKLSKNGHTYLFRHYRDDSQDQTGLNKNVWGATFDHNNGNLVDAIEPSAASESLLRSVLGIDSNHVMIYSRPSACADIVIRTDTNPGLCDELLIGSLRLRIKYDWSQRNATQVVVGVDTSDSTLQPCFEVDTKDLNNRQDGVGAFYRTYQKSTYGDRKVTITAPRTWNGWRFKKWTRRNGSDLPAAFYTSSYLEVSVPLNNSYNVRSQYVYTGTMAPYGDLNVDNDVDMSDFAKFGACWLRQDCTGAGMCLDADLNADGVVDRLDLEILILHWLD